MGRVGVIVNVKGALPPSGNPRDATPAMSGKAKKGRNANCGVERAETEPEPESEPGGAVTAGRETTLVTVVAADPWTSASPL